MKERDYDFRKKSARQTALSVERAFMWRCKTLGIDPDTVIGSPLLIIAARQAEIKREQDGRETFREKLREVPGLRF